MKVHPDLFMYEGGVFSCVGHHPKTGFTSVRIIGWGEEALRGEVARFWVSDQDEEGAAGCHSC